MPSRSSHQRSVDGRPPSPDYGAAAFASPYMASEDWWASGLEMTMVGIIEAVVTYSLGLAFGAMA